MHLQQMIDEYFQDLKLVVECCLSSVKAYQALHPGVLLPQTWFGNLEIQQKDQNFVTQRNLI